MKIFVAGATGVLGRRAVQGLIYSGHQVVGLSRSNKNDQILNKLGAEPRHGDLFDKKSIISVSSDCDVILHLATAIPTKVPNNPEDWELNDRIRIEGTKNLLEAAEKNNFKLYVQQSLTALYGNQNGGWVDKKSKVSLKLPQSVKSSVEMEKLVTSASVPSIILRFGTFYSFDSSLTVSTFDMVKKGMFNIIGDGNVYWNLINVDDAADAVVKTVNNGENNKGKTFNICDDEPVLYKDVISFIAEKLDAERPGTIPIAKAEQMLGSGILEYLLTSYRCSNKKAKEELDWQPVYPDYKTGYTHEIDKWFNNNSNQVVFTK
jgi:nucleoside-diphosphate-sugar epimerase